MPRDVITCIHCRQAHEDGRHECLQAMSMEEVLTLPEDVINHLLAREYRARFLQALFEEETLDHGRLAELTSSITRPALVDAIALARERMAKDMELIVGIPDGASNAHLAEFERMAESLVDRLFPETDQG